MKSKIGSRNIEIILLMLILLLPFFSDKTVIVTAGMIISAAYSWWRGEKIKKKTVYDRNLYRILRLFSAASAAVVLCLYIIQIFYYDLSFYNILMQFKVVLQIYIGIVVILVFYHSTADYEQYVKAFIIFLIIFSVYYLAYVALHGMTSGRSSIFYSFSANYCAASIYFCYPVLFYYYFETGKNKKLKNLIVASVALSLIVILLSGSRTAFGIVGIIGVLQYFCVSRKTKMTLRANILVVSLIAVVVAAYFAAAPVRSLIDRALGALGGTSTVNNDIRTVIWASFLDTIKRGNMIIGQATNMVDTFGWLQPAHNFMIEVLLDVGILGLLVYLVHAIGSFVLMFLKSKGIKKVYLIQILAAFMITAYVQPFFSTTFNCGFITWISVLAIYKYSPDSADRKKTGRQKRLWEKQETKIK